MIFYPASHGAFMLVVIKFLEEMQSVMSVIPGLADVGCRLDPLPSVRG